MVLSKRPKEEENDANGAFGVLQERIETKGDETGLNRDREGR